MLAFVTITDVLYTNAKISSTNLLGHFGIFMRLGAYHSRITPKHLIANFDSEHARRRCKEREERGGCVGRKERDLGLFIASLSFWGGQEGGR